MIPHSFGNCNILAKKTETIYHFHRHRRTQSHLSQPIFLYNIPKIIFQFILCLIRYSAVLQHIGYVEISGILALIYQAEYDSWSIFQYIRAMWKLLFYAFQHCKASSIHKNNTVRSACHFFVGSFIAPVIVMIR